MSNVVIVRCNACGKIIDMTKAPAGEEKLTHGRVGMYFDCPECKTRYRFASVSPRGLQLKREIALAGVKLKKCHTQQDRAACLTQRAALLTRYKIEVTGPYKEEEVLR